LLNLPDRTVSFLVYCTTERRSREMGKIHSSAPLFFIIDTKTCSIQKVNPPSLRWRYD
jgi:hypothetical protein